MRLSIVIFDGFTTLDAIGGYEVLSRIPGMEVEFVAATNWFYQDRLRAHGTEFTPARYHRDGKYVTGAGVSPSLDTAIFLTDLIAGEMIAKAIQLGVEYYPAPPFPERTPAEVAPEIQDIVRAFEDSGGAEVMALTPPFASVGRVAA